MDEKTKAYYREWHKQWRAKHPGYPPNEDASIRKACPRCKEEMPATAEFFGKEKTRPLGLSSFCRKCLSKSKAAYAKGHRDKVNETQRAYRRRGQNERKYTLRGHGMTMEEYDTLLNAQGGVCAICSAPPQKRDKFRLHVDHAHDATQRNRGLLCMRCNQSIERIENDPEWGTKALNYLARFIEQTVKV